MNAPDLGHHAPHPGHVEGPGRCLGCVQEDALRVDPHEALAHIAGLVAAADDALADEHEAGFREAIMAMHGLTTRLATLVRTW